MRRAVFALALLVPSGVSAQAGASSTATAGAAGTGLHPAGVAVRSGTDGGYYVTDRGMTLYALDQRIASGRTGTPNYCVGPCTRVWTPYAAAAGAKPVGDWTIVTAGSGPQWAFKRKPVFTYNADAKPGDMAGDKVEDLWSVIEHVPPPPVLVAPATVVPLYRRGGYVLGNVAGQLLFTAAAPCAECAPFAAGMAARDVGEWTVLRDADRQQWAYRGQPVFVAGDDAPAQVPSQGVAIRLRAEK